MQAMCRTRSNFQTPRHPDNCAQAPLQCFAMEAGKEGIRLKCSFKEIAFNGANWTPLPLDEYQKYLEDYPGPGKEDEGILNGRPAKYGYRDDQFPGSEYSECGYKSSDSPGVDTNRLALDLDAVSLIPRAYQLTIEWRFLFAVEDTCKNRVVQSEIMDNACISPGFKSP